MSCPTCAGGLPPSVEKCPGCGAINPHFDAVGVTMPRWKAADPVLDTTGRSADPPDTILGFVVLYSDSSDPPGDLPDAHFGRVYPLRKGDVFFVGKPPLPTEVPTHDGGKAAPTAHHLFPFTEDFAHISRRHAVVEMRADGSTALTDLSTNGLFLMKAQQHLRRPKNETMKTHVLTGGESVVLGVDLSAVGDPSAREKASRYLLQILPVNSLATDGGTPR